MAAHAWPQEMSPDKTLCSGRRRSKTKVALESRRKPLLGSHEPGLSEESLENEEVLDGHAQNLRDVYTVLDGHVYIGGQNKRAGRERRSDLMI